MSTLVPGRRPPEPEQLLRYDETPRSDLLGPDVADLVIEVGRP